ncbi:MAG TPA: hypothetical protein VJS37_06595 [Terriglobales bacterium]|nr:hypothetical protein [Terriglobales bacterium]
MDYDNHQPEPQARASGDDYLWDGSGQTDPEIQKLEALLGKFQHDHRDLVFPEIVQKHRWLLLSPRMRPSVLAVGLISAVVIMAAIFVHQREQRTPVALSGWNVSRVAGTPYLGNVPVGRKEDSRLEIGQILETDLQSRARLRAESVGQIELEPNTRVRLLAMAAGLKRIALDRGTIHTYIWAPPGQFVVDTPAAMTVDLGCAYTLQVDDSGAGLVRTSLGWVGFKLQGRESFIPAGAACATRPRVGPGTPYFEDASARFRSALRQFDFEDKTPQQRATDLATVLSESRKRDALSLWHLLSRVDTDQRMVVYERLRTLAPPPADVTKEGVLRLDPVMLDRWWNELGFDDISVWRHWERSWSATAVPQQK